ncbi:MAG: hypothetical protein KC442_25280 [Thermomicrobiales bacterium]|nr:hypothetical protein [Thermomicrobiales bacterium]
MSTDKALVADPTPSTGSRRGALAALMAGSALGLAALGAAPQAAAAKGKKSKKKSKGSKSGTTVGGSLPSVRYAYNTTTFSNDGVVTASAACPSGYLPIGAGFWGSIPDPVILTSIPQLENNTWEFEFDGAQTGHQMTVVAICLAASDDTTVEDTEHRSARRKKSKRARRK